MFLSLTRPGPLRIKLLRSNLTEVHSLRLSEIVPSLEGWARPFQLPTSKV